ncbi:hypothetical protein Metli_0695 [Methanofollis liminatans DSM 4140]|uniref:Uncharacterized protein n=1 Tax=Methanofollis liminatans DSM 4140 TaxID=28892 RepID=J0S7X6_9EURY|nr:hypothetical protein [Methanofollis liminatans]EJG06659.1 hypothetical protein Metli_0695 [Methanofollis liminatans DSM 4140]
MEKLPNIDIETRAVGDVIAHLRRAGMTTPTIEKVLQSVAWVCDVRAFKFHDIVVGEYAKVMEGTIPADVAFDRILLTFRLPDRDVHVSAEEAELMRGFRAAGYSVRKICAVFDRSTETVHRLTADVETPAKQTPETLSASSEAIYG